MMDEVTAADIDTAEIRSRLDHSGRRIVMAGSLMWELLGHIDQQAASLARLEPREWRLGDSALFGGQVVTLTRIDTENEPHGAWVTWKEGGCQHDQFAHFPTPGELQPIVEDHATTEAPASDLLPCPFCGGQAVYAARLRDGCQQGDIEAFAHFCRCLSCASEGGWGKSEGSARRCWNMRVPATAPAHPQVKAPGAVCGPESPSGPESLYPRVNALEMQVAALDGALGVVDAWQTQMGRRDGYLDRLEQRAEAAEKRLDEIAEWIAGQQRGRYYAGKTRPVGVERP